MELDLEKREETRKDMLAAFREAQVEEPDDMSTVKVSDVPLWKERFQNEYDHSGIGIQHDLETFLIKVFPDQRDSLFVEFVREVVELNLVVEEGGRPKFTLAIEDSLTIVVPRLDLVLFENINKIIPGDLDIGYARVSAHAGGGFLIELNQDVVEEGRPYYERIKEAADLASSSRNADLLLKMMAMFGGNQLSG